VPCALLVSPDLTAPLAGTSGSVPIFLPLTDPALVGAALYMQGGALDPTANPGGLVLSQGTCSTIGAK